MKKFLKIVNLFLVNITILSAFILLRGDNFAFASQGLAETSTQNTQITQQANKEITQNSPSTIPEKNFYKLTHLKKNSLKYKFLKFFIAIFGVLISSLTIFLGLIFYKKYILKNNLNPSSIDYSKTLESPKDFKDAINLFLDKTDKE